MLGWHPGQPGPGRAHHLSPPLTETQREQSVAGSISEALALCKGQMLYFQSSSILPTTLQLGGMAVIPPPR